MSNNTSLIEALGIEALAKEEQGRIIEMATKRLNEVLINTIVENISDEQATQMHDALMADQGMEERIADVTARVPALATKIELAMQKEILVLRMVARQ